MGDHTMPDKDVEVTVQFDRKQLHIYHNLPAELQCDLSHENDGTDDFGPFHMVDYGYQTDITLTLKDSLPGQSDYDKNADDLASTVVTIANQDGTTISFEYDVTPSAPNADQLVIHFESGITKNIVITVTQVPKNTYSGHWNLTGLTVNVDEATLIPHGTECPAGPRHRT